MMPPVMAVRALRTLSSAPQVVHFIPMQATPRPAMDTMIPTIIKARVAWRSPTGDRELRTGNDKQMQIHLTADCALIVSFYTKTGC